jgi:transposase InsO family protein
MMCRVRAVSRAGCYAWLDRAPSRRAQGDVRLRVAIRASHAESRLSYGRPRIHRERRAQGQCPGRKRIARLMQLEGRRAKRSRRYRTTTRRDATRPAALRRAFAQRQPAAGLLHHADRGTPYTAEEYRAALTAAHLAVRMSRRGDCWDHAVMESFFAPLKTELVHAARWATRAQAAAALAAYIEGWYNRRRRHSTLDYLSPAEYECRLRAA